MLANEGGDASDISLINLETEDHSEVNKQLRAK